MKSLRLVGASLIAMALTLSLVGSVVSAAPPKAARLLCFQGGDATCVVDRSNNTAQLIVGAGGYAGVYTNGKSYSGKLLSDVDFSFTYNGDVGGGSPRLSIPIDSNGDGKTDAYAFIDAANCGYTSDTTNTFHVVGTDVSTCQVFYGSESFANWDAFAAAYPTYRIASGTYAFVIADQPGRVTIYSVSLG